MALLVKMMSDEDTEDADTRKAHTLFVDVVHINFERGVSGLGYMNLRFKDSEDPETFEVVGNVYVMNENGKTISTFGSAPLIFADGQPT